MKTYVIAPVSTETGMADLYRTHLIWPFEDRDSAEEEMLRMKAKYPHDDFELFESVAFTREITTRPNTYVVEQKREVQGGD